MLTAHIRATALAATGLSCLTMAILYGQARLWPVALVLATGAVVCADTARHVIQAAAERHAPAAAVERPAPALDDVVAAELNGACCELWWTSAGTQHSHDPKEPPR